ncbi:radical SAM protein [Planotetraspora sp. A-T 1434]|uniref:radical SAM protein n=1 Tax=Planotetraspora sp. A-T 1434 TaxID=2979219 RepID=UPI0021BFF14F|nr:radical SAM protein [Planotetraspora sp. A-T 1434]MCT9933604.1 radical SAM protein [Planotetraspora sp. A-T 1434]
MTTPTPRLSYRDAAPTPRLSYRDAAPTPRLPFPCGEAATSPRLRLADVEAARDTPGASALLFITDRCPVGCGHCSVDSRPDSPRVTDFTLFEGVLDALCAGEPRLIGVSGGEPFAERRALTLAADRITAAGKHLVVYTSGFWGNRTSGWVRRVLRACSCVFLSTDAFHQARLADERFANAARAIADEGTPLVVQVVDDQDAVDRAVGLLEQALGPCWPEAAELNRVGLLPYGRAAGLVAPRPLVAGKDFGPCRVARSPVVRYDGVVAACCNEAVVMGRGPAEFRRTCGDAPETAEALKELRHHAMFSVVATVGPGPITADPRLADLADRRFTSICELCWLVAERIPDPAHDPLLTMLGVLGGARRPGQS